MKKILEIIVVLLLLLDGARAKSVLDRRRPEPKITTLGGEPTTDAPEHDLTTELANETPIPGFDLTITDLEKNAALNDRLLAYVESSNKTNTDQGAEDEAEGRSLGKTIGWVVLGILLFGLALGLCIFIWINCKSSGSIYLPDENEGNVIARYSDTSLITFDQDGFVEIKLSSGSNQKQPPSSLAYTETHF